MTTLGAAIDDLMATIAARAGGDPAHSYTAALIAAGPRRCAQKLGEEAVEAALAAGSEDADALTKEAADLLYHLGVTLHACGVSGEAVAAELAARRGRSGLEEKAERG